MQEVNACNAAIEWAEERTIEDVVKDRHRGDWLLWLAKKIDMDIVPLTLAKGYCANTVRHLMKDQRSIDAVDAAIKFGLGELTLAQLFEAKQNAASASADASASARKSNQQKTADLCREYIGELIIKLVNEKLKYTP